MNTYEYASVYLLLFVGILAAGENIYMHTQPQSKVYLFAHEFNNSWISHKGDRINHFNSTRIVYGFGLKSWIIISSVPQVWMLLTTWISSLAQFQQFLISRR
jgi:hypothetical protein